MSGKQSTFKAMNKGSWRMSQPCRMVAAVHRLNKTENYQPKGSSQNSIYKGQVYVAGVLAQGHRKAQRCFICFVPFLFWIQFTSKCFTANFLWGIVCQTERKGKDLPVKIKNKQKNLRAQLCPPQWETVLPFPPWAQTEESCLSQCSSGWCCSLSLSSCHFSWHSMIQTKHFKGRKIMDSADF